MSCADDLAVARADLAAANAQIAELEDTTASWAEYGDEDARMAIQTLQARIDKALALADEWDRHAAAAPKKHPTTATTLCVCGEGDFIGDSTPGPCYIDAAGFTVHRPTTATAEGSDDD